MKHTLPLSARCAGALALVLVVAILSAPPSAMAQNRRVPTAPAARGPIALLPERVVAFKIGGDPRGAALAAGAVLVDSFGDGLVPLGPNGPGTVALLRWPSARAALAGERILITRADVRFVESNELAAPGETVDCGVQASAGVQQCTAAFFDGDPTGPEYTQQPALPAIDLSGISQAVPHGETIVAVIDTGVDPAHRALVGRLFGPGFDFLRSQAGGYEVANMFDDDFDGEVDEGHGHGTHIAGTIALIDPQALILPYRVLDSEGNGRAFDVALAIRAAGEAEAHFINLSLGLARRSAAVLAAIESLDDGDTVVLTSAGNSGLACVGHPARSNAVIAVAAVDSTGVLAPFASFGQAVDLVAPGVDIYGPMPGDAWARWSGSSMAVAVATGAASRLHSWRMVHEPEDVIEALLDSALPVDDLNPGAAGLVGHGIPRLGDAAAEIRQ